MTRLTTLSKIIHPVSCKYGAPLGRSNKGTMPEKGKIFDKAVPMSKDAGYDKGGVYWGIGKQLRVRFTKDMAYIEFYRLGDSMPEIKQPATLVKFFVEEGEVLAVFPQSNYNKRLYGNTAKNCYRHVGQHGRADTDYYKALQKATPEQFADLKRELESYPYNYNLKVCK